MANCITLTQGRRLTCKGGLGGMKGISFGVWSENIISAVDGEVSSLSPAFTALYRYELKNAGNTYIEEIAADAEARTVVFNGTLSVALHKLDLATRNEIRMLAMGELVIFIETYNGDVFVIGAENGAELTGGSIAETGGAKADFYGSKLTFTTSESEPYNRLDAAGLVDYAAIIVNGL